MKQKRSRNLSIEDIETIASILDGWSGPLTWNLLIEAVFARLHFRYTRQALHNHQRLRIAFETRKSKVQTQEPVMRGSVQLQKALERIVRLEFENERLKSENDNLLEQFARWAFNAYVRGIGEAELNRPLPEIDRKRTPTLVFSAKGTTVKV